jgi:hypothetical protein
VFRPYFVFQLDDTALRPVKLVDLQLELRIDATLEARF